MQLVNVIAFALCTLPLAAGAVLLVRERGYSFDLRKKASRRKDPTRSGGRRADDQVAA